jgi:chemotaxis protein methyltransferase CheR
MIPAMVRPDLDAGGLEAFRRVSRLMYRISGVNLTDGKQELVGARIAKRMRVLGQESVTEYVDFVEGPGGADELAHMVDVLTTNKTSFFREEPHFDFLASTVIPGWLASGGPLRIWSAGCSSGEEPYSVAMLLLDRVPDLARRDVRILATDLSRPVLAKAQAAVYDEPLLDSVPRALRDRYTTPKPGIPGGAPLREMNREVRSLVSFAQLNLMAHWPMRGPFDVIMCRNVMIYFDRDTRQRLVERMAGLLRERGHLLVGHSESLNGLDHGLSYVQPAVYRR